jgi:uncharacterized protein (TIGR02246 family)
MKTLVLCLALAFAAPASADDTSALVAKFTQAWDAGDAKGLAALFAPGADLVTPDGKVISGRANIEAFYAYVFAHGYAGVKAEATVVVTRTLAPDLDIVDARWSIGDKEKGIMAAVLCRNADGWRILALRENRGATDLSAFAP